jgi:hypothetical protein
MNGHKTKQLRKKYIALTPKEKALCTFRKFKKLYQENRFLWNKKGVLL